MILILAIDRRAAEHAARYELHLNPDEWRYISRVHQIYELHGPDYRVRFGHGFWNRKDAQEMLHALASRGFRYYRPQDSE